MASRPRLTRQRLQHLEELCAQRGVPLTVQRRTILECVLDHGYHPSADEVYDLAHRRLPDISRTTVYRVLETLVNLGVITKACHPGVAARYDAELQRHHHLVCTHCEKIFDLLDATLDKINLPHRQAEGFVIHDYSIYFRGFCPDCRRKTAAPRPSAGRRRRTNATKPRRKIPRAP